MRTVPQDDVQQDHGSLRILGLIRDALLPQGVVNHRVRPAYGKLVRAEVYDGVLRRHVRVGETVRAGGRPWCVQTCPSDALMYGTREEVHAEAFRRLEKLRERYPNAQIYGETQTGGLGMLLLTPDDPELLDIPLDPKKPFVSDVWQKVVQPGAVAVTLGAAVLAGVGGVIARRRHQEELVVLEAEGLIGDAEDTEQEEG